MRLLIHCYEYPPLGGGAANAIYYILKQFEAYTDLEVDVVTSSIDKQGVDVITDNIRVHYLDIGKNGTLHFQSQKDLLKYSWQSYWYTKKILQKKKYDLLHAFFGIPSGFISMMLRIPYIVSLRGSDVPFFNERFRLADKLIFKRLNRLIWNNALRVIANSTGLRSLAHSTHPQIPIDIIPNGIDTSYFIPRTRVWSGTINIVTTCRLIKRKAVDILIIALRNMANIRLTVIGDGPERMRLEELADQYAVPAVFLGCIDHSKIYLYLRSADLFVLPSTNEGMSNSVLEAMACGLAIIATDVGGSRELIKSNGFIIQVNNSDQLRAAISCYLKSPALLKSHGNESRRIAEEMDWKNVALSYYNIYRKCISKNC